MNHLCRLIRLLQVHIHRRFRMLTMHHRISKSFIIQTSPVVKDKVLIEHLMKKDIYRVVVTSYSLILSLRVRIPPRAVLYIWAHNLSPVLYSIFPLYRLSEAFLGLKYIFQKCVEFDSTGYVQVSLNSIGWTRRSDSILLHMSIWVVECFAYGNNGRGLGAPTPGRTGLDWQNDRPSRTTYARWTLNARNYVWPSLTSMHLKLQEYIIIYINAYGKRIRIALLWLLYSAHPRILCKTSF